MNARRLEQHSPVVSSRADDRLHAARRSGGGSMLSTRMVARHPRAFRSRRSCAAARRLLVLRQTSPRTLKTRPAVSLRPRARRCMPIDRNHPFSPARRIRGACRSLASTTSSRARVSNSDRGANRARPAPGHPLAEHRTQHRRAVPSLRAPRAPQSQCPSAGPPQPVAPPGS